MAIELAQSLMQIANCCKLRKNATAIEITSHADIEHLLTIVRSQSGTNVVHRTYLDRSLICDQKLSIFRIHVELSKIVFFAFDIFPARNKPNKIRTLRFLNSLVLFDCLFRRVGRFFLVRIWICIKHNFRIKMGLVV